VTLKTLAIITLVVLGSSFASAQTGTFYIWDSTDIQYCNFYVITYNSGVVAGVDNLTTYCQFPVDATVVGFDTTLPNDGLPTHGKGMIFGDNIYDAECYCYSGDQWTVWLSGKYSKEHGKGDFYGPYGWLGVAGVSGFYFGDNYGWVSSWYDSRRRGGLDAGPSVVPKSKVAGDSTTAGTPPEELRK